ncbi:centromere protein P [Echinops telfairi]|uniref:Centromere protein P n=1 Tax=Echinops telfairi TaxID=9371 RepID=A0ABM0ZU32_ECHTE|nr:centromere protein P [Echinops telfairi]
MDVQEDVRALEAEIAALRRACEAPTAPGREACGTKKSLKNIYQPKSEGWESATHLRRPLGRLESELSFLSTLIGISIRKYSKKTEDLTRTEMTQRNITKILQRYRLSGSCHMVTFQLEFQILETQNEEILSSVITDLNIIVEPTDYAELSEFVCRVEERRDLFMFFRSLHFFVEWCEYRKCTFKHFKEKYPNIVYLPEGATSNYMGIQSASHAGLELIIVWRLQIDDKGKVLPVLDLLTKIPQQALELDKKKVTESAPLNFRTLLGVLGIEASLENLIKLFSTQKND